MDLPIHLAGLTITKKEPHSEPSVTIPVWITQSFLDGMIELMMFLDGLQKGAQIGTVPGAFELTMFYRTLREAISRAETDANNEAARIAEIPEGEPTDYNPDYVSSDGKMRDRFGRRVLTIEESKARWASEPRGC